MSVIVLSPLASFLEPIVDHFARERGTDSDSGSTVAWWAKFAACLAIAIVTPYLLLILLTAIIAILKHSTLGDMVLMGICIFFCGWLFALPCVLAVLISAFFGRYFAHALTILLPFFLLVGWDTLSLWWDWQDEESRFHDICFGDQLLNWGFYAGQTISASGVRYFLCAVAIRLGIIVTGRLCSHAIRQWYHPAPIQTIRL